MKTLLFFVLAVPFAFCQETQNPPPPQTEPVPANTTAQAPPAAPATPPPAPAALPAPSITGPLQELPPAIFDAGPFGKLAVNGFLSGMGLWQSNHIPGDDSTQAALSNGQVFLQKTDGWFQFYLQAGAYNIPALGVPVLAPDQTGTALSHPLQLAERLLDLCQRCPQCGIRRHGKPGAGEVSESGHAGAKQRHDVRRAVHVQQSALDHPALQIGRAHV